MNIQIQNCNNILNGTVNIVEDALNIKYAINGTGKSTIAKAIFAESQQDTDALKLLKPYQFQTDEMDHNPTVIGLDNIRNIKIFDEEYINQYVYQPDELLKNSFEIFVKTQNYDQHMNQIQRLLSDIGRNFRDNPDMEELILAFSQFVDGCGKNKSGLAASSPLVKGFGKGNKISNIPEGLEVFSPYLNNTQNADNVKWLKWQSNGKKYLDMANQCPYCSGSIEHTKDKILRVSQEYNSKEIEHLDKMLKVFAQLKPYFSSDTNNQIETITNNAGNMNESQKNYLYEIKKQVETMLTHLKTLQYIGFQTLKDVNRMTSKLQSYIIDIDLFSHLQSDLMKEKINLINQSLEAVLEKAGRLQGEINQQNGLIRKTIEENSTAINEFLKCAGYEYVVAIEEIEDRYRMILKSANYDTEIESVKDHLSYGERNALALALFMFSVLKDNPDMVILDDPISSFDGNKKFALLNMLFMSEKCLRNRTVLMLTHDFNTVIDVIHTMPQNFNPRPHADFLSTINGNLIETTIEKRNIQSFHEIALKNLQEEIDTLNKAVYLRRLLEAEGNKDLEWQLLSNLFHKREEPIIQIHGNENREMTAEEIRIATAKIKEYIADFDYNTEYEKTQNRDCLIDLYRRSTNNYEKLQLYRILYNSNNENPVVKKFVNETFHVENDYLFQLNPREYDTIPQYIISECDKDIL